MTRNYDVFFVFGKAKKLHQIKFFVELGGCRVVSSWVSLVGPSESVYLAMDVFTTVRQFGFRIEVRTDYSQKMDRYAFLMIE